MTSSCFCSLSFFLAFNLFMASCSSLASFTVSVIRCFVSGSIGIGRRTSSGSIPRFSSIISSFLFAMTTSNVFKVREDKP